MKQVTWICLCWFSLLSVSAQATDEALPPEVKALIGMKLQPDAAIRRLSSPDSSTDIPNLIINRAGTLGDQLHFEAGEVGCRWPVFLVASLNKDKSMEIRDVLILPSNLINWKCVDGKFRYLEGRLTVASDGCRVNDEDKRIIVGLVKPEKGRDACGHVTSRVKQAWQIDKQTGRISPISTKGLQCVYIEGCE